MRTGRGWTIPAAAIVAAGETAVLISVLLARDAKSSGFYAILLAVKLPFCALLLRRSAAAWFALLLYEGTGVFAALTAPGVPVLLRAAELALAVAVIVLLVAALPLFPRLDRLEIPDR